MARVKMALCPSAIDRYSQTTNILDSRFVYRVGEAKEAERDCTSDDEPDSPDWGLCLCIDVRKEFGERESAVSRERPCLSTGWQHQRGRHGHLCETHEAPDYKRSFGTERLKINVGQWLSNCGIIYSRNIGAHSEGDDDQDDCAEDPSTANGTHYGVSVCVSIHDTYGTCTTQYVKGNQGLTGQRKRRYWPLLKSKQRNRSCRLSKPEPES
jgi:hypothetical protein